MQEGRFWGVVVIASLVSWVGLSALSLVGVPLPASMRILVGINFGVIVGGVDALRARDAEGRSTGGQARVKYDVAAVGVIVAGALLGTHFTWGMDLERSLAIRLLVLSTGSAGFFLGRLCDARANRCQGTGGSGKDWGR